jgi:hypothetical protein
MTLATAAYAGGLFTRMSPEEARTRPGLTIVELYMAEACEGPDPWLEPELNSWPKKHSATMVRYDWRAEATSVKEAIGSGLKIAPQRIAWRDGVEIDRLCGCADPDDLNLWLTAITAGTTRGDILRATLAERGFDIGLSLEIAKVEVCGVHPDRAWDALFALWEQIPEKAPQERYWRAMRVAPEMASIGKKYPAIREKIVALRDDLTGAKDKDVHAFDDWFALNRVLGDDAMTVTWYDDNRNDPALSDVIEHARLGVFQLHTDKKRWAEAASLVTSPEMWLERAPPRGATLQLVADAYLALMIQQRQKEGKVLLKAILKEAGKDGAQGCAMLKLVTEHPKAVHKDQKVAAKACADEAVVTAWEALLP